MKMHPWANHPQSLPNNRLKISAPKLQHIPSNQWVKIELGIILTSLPQHHIIKINNPQTKYKIISNYWLSSTWHELSLTIIAPKSFDLYPGETLCHLQLLPLHHFFPGTLYLHGLTYI
jgi:hypothetical protein